MRLTRHQRETFVNAVMSDVPNVGQQIQKKLDAYALEVALKRLPPAVRKLWDNNELRGYIVSGYLRGVAWTNTVVPAPNFVQLTIEEMEQMQAMVEARDNAYKRDRELSTKLLDAVAGCATHKQVKDMFPEFAKYLPTNTDRPVDRSLPVAANVMAELVQAGWPKEEK